MSNEKNLGRTLRGRLVSRTSQAPIARDILISDVEILAAAAVQADVTREHRAATKRLRELVTDLADELAIYLALIRDLRQNPPALTEDGDVEAHDDRMRKVKLMLTIVGNPVDGVGKLAQAIHRLVATDRVIYGIDSSSGNTSHPDQAALGKLKEWDRHTADEMAKRPYLLAKPAPLAGSN